MHKIAIDYTPAYEQGAGIGRYVRELVTYLAKHDKQTAYKLFVSGAAYQQLDTPLPDNFSWHPTRISPKWLARLWHRLHIPLPVEIFTGNIDLFHATDFVLPPVKRTTKTLLTVHDLSFVRVPETTSPSLKRYLDVVVPRSAKKATHILADSSATKTDLIDLYDIAPEKITVLLSGVDPRFKHVETKNNELFTKYNIPDRPYIFSVGTVQPRKNYSRLVEAVHQLRSTGHDVDLVIAGGRGWLEGTMYETIDRLKLSDHVHLIGFADDADLPMLYSYASCVAFVSLYEGFGFPVLESMGCGTPVVTSNISSMPEVAGDAALLVDPYDIDAIAHSIQSVLTDSHLKSDLIEKGYKQAQRFTWQRSAKALQKIYNQVLNDEI